MLVAEVRSGQDSRHNERTEIALGTWQIQLGKAIKKYMLSRVPSAANTGEILDGTGKLVVLAAFSKTDEGQLVPAFEPRLVDTEERAIREARLMAS